MIIKKLVKQKKGNRDHCYLNFMALNIIFMGTPEFAVPILKAIYDSNMKLLKKFIPNHRKRKIEDKK